MNADLNLVDSVRETSDDDEVQVGLVVVPFSDVYSGDVCYLNDGDAKGGVRSSWCHHRDSHPLHHCLIARQTHVRHPLTLLLLCHASFWPSPFRQRVSFAI